MINYLKRLLDYIYKKKCYFCSSSKENSFFCNNCYEKIELLQNSCLSDIEFFKCYAASFYKGDIKKLIRAVKYHNQRDLSYFQAKIMFDYWQTVFDKEENYIVIPVPLHKNRTKKRHYNHMCLVGKEFAQMAGYTFCDNLIERTKDTKPQYKLNKEQRKENLKNAFLINNSIYDFSKKQNILLIDDITTTGTTFEEIIKAMKKEGFNNITAFATATPEKKSFYTY